MALGSALWGWLASLAGTRIALAAAAGTMLRAARASTGASGCGWATRPT